jgi:hypothetical protein
MSSIIQSPAPVPDRRENASLGRSGAAARRSARIIRTNATTVAVMSMALIARPVATFAADKSAIAPPRARGGGDQDRHLMMPSPPIHQPSDARHSGWLPASRAPAYCGWLNRRAALPTLSRNARCDGAPTSRDFVPWRFSDAGRPSASRPVTAGVRKPAHKHIRGRLRRRAPPHGRPTCLNTRP